MMYPVILFCYNRLDTLKLTVASLRKNSLAASTELYIFSDASNKPADVDKVKEVRQFIHSIDGFKTVFVTEADQNKGLARSIIDGVSLILKTHEAAIVLEDDLLTSPNFLSYMNQCLEYYQSNHKIFSVSGYTVPIKFPESQVYDNYFTRRGSSWGWGIWKNRWMSIDWEIPEYKEFSKDVAARKRFNKMGSDLAGMLDKQMTGKINSWAIRWCYHQFKTDCYTVFPNKSKVQNIGFTEAATHTNTFQLTRFYTKLDESTTERFKLNPFPKLDDVVIKQFTKTYSIATRIKYKLLGLAPIQAILRLQRL